MLGLPKSTELSKQLPKKAIYEKFNMNSVAKKRLDNDIARITIVNEVLPSKISIAQGKSVKAFYVLLVTMKNNNYDEKNIVAISKIIPQKLIMVLEYEGKAKIAIYHSKLISTCWKNTDELFITLNGLNLDAVWENIIIQVGGISIESGNTLDKQIELDEQRKKVLRQIETLERKARNENNPRKKFELAQEIQKLKIIGE